MDVYKQALIEQWPVPRGLILADDMVHSGDPVRSLIRECDAARRARDSKISLFPSYDQAVELEENLDTKTHISIIALSKLALPDSAMAASGNAIHVSQKLQFYWAHCEKPPSELVDRATNDICATTLTHDSKYLIFRDLSALVQIDQLWAEYRDVASGKIQDIWPEHVTTPPSEPADCAEAEIAIWGWRRNSRGNFESGITRVRVIKEDDQWRVAEVRSLDSDAIKDAHEHRITYSSVASVVCSAVPGSPEWISEMMEDENEADSEANHG